MSEDISKESLEEAAGSWAPEVRFFEECDSTNRIAKQWADEGAPDGSLVLADHQTAGRGRMSRSWVSVPGTALQFSLVLRPEMSLDSVGLLNLVAGAALAIAVERLGVPARVKWPNDLILDGRKAAGILSEAITQVGAVTAVILGIGLNVNLRSEDLPEELAATATSLLIASGRSFDRLDVLAAFLSEFGPRYSGLGGARIDEVLGEYRRHCETIGQVVRIEVGDKVLEGEATDVDVTGALLLAGGERITAGDVSMPFQAGDTSTS